MGQSGVGEVGKCDFGYKVTDVSLRLSRELKSA